MNRAATDSGAATDSRQGAMNRAATDQGAMNRAATDQGAATDSGAVQRPLMRIAQVSLARPRSTRGTRLTRLMEGGRFSAMTIGTSTMR